MKRTQPPKILHKWKPIKTFTRKEVVVIPYVCVRCGVTATRYRMSPTVSIDKQFGELYYCPSTLRK